MSANLDMQGGAGTYFRLPQIGGTGDRPSSPTQGMMIWRTDINAVEVYDGTNWKDLAYS